MNIHYFSVLAALACFASSAFAEEETNLDWNTQTLTGDWGGVRSSLHNRGVTMEFNHKSDLLNNSSGGIQRGTAWMGNTEAQIQFDMDKLLEWNGTTAYLHYHSQLGSKFNNSYVGSFDGADNIETAVNTAQIYQAWVQKYLADDSVSLLAGLYAIDSEFYVTDTSWVFVQPTYGMSSELAQSGKNGPPVFPMGALGLRLKFVTPGKHFYLQGAVTDGVPGDPENLHGTQIKLGHGDGALSIVEFGYTPQESEPAAATANPTGMTESELKVHGEYEAFNKTAIGLWHFSGNFDDLTEVDALGSPLHRTGQGIYFLAERTLMVEKNHPSQGLSGFVRFGRASKDINQSDWSASLGLRYRGLFSGRDNDIAGIAITVHHASKKYRALNNSESSETGVEATYHAQIKPWLALQPTLQYFHNPNMDPTLQDVRIIGIRTEIDF